MILCFDSLACLRQGHADRWPRSRGTSRRREGFVSADVTIHVRPPDVADRLVPGHWEGDFIKGAANRSAVGTLVERSSRLVLLARMDDCSSLSALNGFTRALQAIPQSMRATLTYDRGSEMARHRELAQTTGIRVYFADPYSPWQRGSNENANGLIRQYLPKRSDLSGFAQAELDAIADRLNDRPRRYARRRSLNSIGSTFNRRCTSNLTPALTLARPRKADFRSRDLTHPTMRIIRCLGRSF